jgi:hypothetical protein
MIPAKVHRAIGSLAERRPEERDWPCDHDGASAEPAGSEVVIDVLMGRCHGDC